MSEQIYKHFIKLLISKLEYIEGAVGEVDTEDTKRYIEELIKLLS